MAQCDHRYSFSQRCSETVDEENDRYCGNHNRQRALAAAERAVLRCAEEWHAHQVEHGCSGNHYPTVDALRSACRALAEMRAKGGQHG
jgi:hypothetical protein